MEGLVVTEVFHWVVNHFPDIAALILLVAIVAWVAIKINNFGHRFTATEQLCNDIHIRQLPEIRTELKEMRAEMIQIRTEMNERFSKIELSLNTIITYLSIKSGKFSIGENK